MTKKGGGYKTQAGDDMTGHGWVKSYTWLDITRDKKTKKWTVTEYDFDTGNYQCATCNTGDFLWLVPQSQGICLACTGCKEVDCALTKDGSYKIDSRVITPEKALEILQARGVKIHPFELPANLLKDLKKRKSRIIRRRQGKKRPTVKG